LTSFPCKDTKECGDDRTREITLTDENWKKIDELLEELLDSDFLRFCLMNDIVEEGLVSFEKHLITSLTVVISDKYPLKDGNPWCEDTNRPTWRFDHVVRGVIVQWYDCPIFINKNTFSHKKNIKTIRTI